MSLSVRFSHQWPGFALDVSFDAPASGVTALFGPSGSGKTTVADAVAGLLRPDEGRILLGPDVLSDSVAGRFVPARRRHIGYVFQEARLFPHLTVGANLDYGARRRGGVDPSARGRVVEMLGIGDLLARRPAGLSGGERSRVALGRALLARPRLLVLDEPLAALDAPRKGEILPYLERLRDETGVPMLLVSHSLDEVTRLADRMVVLNRGRVAADGTVEEIMARLDLFPLTGRFEAGAVVRGRFRGIGATGLGLVEFDGGQLVVPPLDAAVGDPVRLRIRARDVMLSSVRPVGLSARNVLPARVLEIREETGPYVDIRLGCSGSVLLARITVDACHALDLEPGLAVFAIVKTVSIARGSAAPVKRSGSHSIDGVT